MITKTITFTNTGNKALTGYMAEINLTATEFAFINKLSGNYIKYLDGSSELAYHVVKYDKTNSLIKVFVNVSIAANSTKAITMQSGVISNLGKRFSQLMTRKSVIDITKALYKMDSEHDSMGVGADLGLVNSTLVNSPQFGNVLKCNGVNACGTIVRDWDCLSTYDMCTLSFNFTLPYNHRSGSGNKMLFSKWVDASHYVFIQLLTNGKLRISANGSADTTEVFWQKFEPHSVTIRTNKHIVLVRVDNIQFVRSTPLSGTGGAPFTFGAYNEGTPSQFCEAYFWDIEFTQGQYFIGKEFSRNKCIPEKEDVEYRKWQRICDIPDTEPDNVLRQEPNIITVGTELHLYCTDHEVAVPGVSRRISTNNGVTWSQAETLVITGLATNTARPFVFQDGGKIYIIYQRSSKLYISESTDGINFTNPQVYLDVQAGYTTIENSFVIWDADANKYYGMHDGLKGGLWKTFITSGDTLTGMSKLYDLESYYSTIDASGGVITRLDGGGFLRKLNGVWEMWCHSYDVFRLRNADITTDTWVRVYDNPMFVLNSKWAQEQAADFSMCEKDGICYAAVNNSGDSYGTTGNTSIFKYDGTMEQLVSDLSIAIT
jgi:hypothetical protein